MIRAVGYCDFNECDDMHKGVFLLNHGDTFYCPRCRQPGWVEEEVKTYRDLNGGDKAQAMYREARVKFDFRPDERKYAFTAVVSVDGLLTGAVFEVTSPLVKTEKRALKLAEAALCAVNSGRVDEHGVTTELRIDFDSTDWKEHIQQCERVLTERDRRMQFAVEAENE